MLNRVLLYASALLASACTTSMYNGPRRPASELAILSSEDSTISMIDGWETPYSGGNFARYQLLPGEHAVGVSLNKVMGDGAYRGLNAYTLCLKAEAGKGYRVKIEMQGSLWYPYLVDESNQMMVSYPCREEPSRMRARELARLINEPLDEAPRK